MEVRRIARWYRWIEYAAFGRALEQARFTFLDALAGASRILVLGEGDGRALQQLLAIAPAAEVDVVEASAEMISLARARIGDTPRVRFHCQNVLSASLPRTTYDAVVTFFFLDCFSESELQQVLVHIAPSLKPGAIWLVSEFAIPTRGLRRCHAKVWIWVMYRFFAATTNLRARTLPPIDRLLSGLGLRRTHTQIRRWGLLVSAVFVYPSNRC